MTEPLTRRGGNWSTQRKPLTTSFRSISEIHLAWCWDILHPRNSNFSSTFWCTGWGVGWPDGTGEAPGVWQCHIVHLDMLHPRKISFSLILWCVGWGGGWPAGTGEIPGVWECHTVRWDMLHLRNSNFSLILWCAGWGGGWPAGTGEVPGVWQCHAVCPEVWRGVCSIPAWLCDSHLGLAGQHRSASQVWLGQYGLLFVCFCVLLLYACWHVFCVCLFCKEYLITVRIYGAFFLAICNIGLEWNIVLRKAENRKEWGKLVVKFTVVSQQSARLWDR